MEIVNIGDKQYTIFGKYKGANDNKFNRAAKLAYLFNDINNTLSYIVKDNIQKENSRLALATLCLMYSGIRIGNEDSAEGYMTEGHPNQKDFQSKFVQTYGLSTLKREHFVLYPDKVEILFLGKRYVDNSFTIKEPIIVEGITRLLALNKTADDYIFGITAYSLNKFIKANIGQQFSAKDFRTLKANLEAWNFITTIPEIFLNKEYYKSQVQAMFSYVANKLNNTKGACKKSYVSPDILPYLNMLCS